MALYDAFISYSHAKDKPIAAALQSVVQKLGKPWYRRRALRVFRDDTTLSATPTLWPSIEAALADSRFAILLASPEAAASHWVNKEVAYWLDHKGAGTLLIAVTSGDLAWDNAANDFVAGEDMSPTDMPLPPALRGRFASEPKWVDLRAYRDGADPRDAKFGELAADFAAVLHGMPKEDLLSQEVRQQRRALRLAWSAAAVLLALVGLAGWQWKLQLDARHLAEQQRDRAERALAATADTVTNVSGGIVMALRSRVGMPPDLSRDILQITLNLQREVMRRAETTPEMNYSEAGALNELAKTQLELGDTQNALSSAQRGTLIIDRLAASAPNDMDRQHDRMVSYLQLANVTAATGRRAEALAIYQRELAHAETSLSAHFDEEYWQTALEAAYEHEGDLLLSGGQHREALEAYQKALAMAERRAAADPDDGKQQRGRIGSRIGAARLAAGDQTGALAALEESLAISRELTATKPDDVLEQRVLAARLDSVGDARRTAGDRDGALTGYEESLGIRRKLAAADPDNVEWKNELSTSLDKVGGIKHAAGEAADALALYQESLANRRRLAATIRGQPQWQFNVSVSLERIGDVELEMHHEAKALATYQESLAIRRMLATAVSANADWQWGLSVAYGRLADLFERENRREEAIDSYRSSVAIAEKLAATDTGNAAWQRSLAHSVEKMVPLLEAQGERTEAIAAYRKLIPIMERQAAANPNGTDRQRALAAAYVKLGNLLAAAGAREQALEDSREEALEAYGKNLALTKQFADASPDDAKQQFELVLSHERIGDALRAARRYSEAVDSYRSTVAVIEREVASVENKDAWRAALVIGLGKTGDALAATKQRADAIAEYRKSLAIAEGLAAANPDNADRQVSLALTLRKIAAISEPPQARAALRRALAIIEALAQADKLPAAQRQWPQDLSERLAKLPPEQSEAK